MRSRHARDMQIQHYNRTAHPLPTLSIGDNLAI